MSTAEILFSDDQIEEHDLRIASVVQPTKVDGRRYRLGIANIDSQMRLFYPGEYVLVGAREGVGKTSIAERIGLENSVTERVLFASLEMPTAIMQDRCLAKILGTGLESIEFERSQKTDDFKYAMAELERRDLLVWHPRKRSDRTIQAITKRAEDVTAAMLIIDYTRLISGWQPGMVAADIVNFIVAWAQQTSTTTILLTQLKDDAVGRRPTNGDIQDTTQLAQRADRVLLLYRPFLGRLARDTVAELIVSKNRRGPAFRGHAHWLGAPMDYHEMTPDEERFVACCKPRKT